MSGQLGATPTGEFARLNDVNNNTNYECEISAHEAKGKRAQKGTVFCSLVADGNGNPPPAPNTWEADLSVDGACVVVNADGTARIAGIVTQAEGNNELGLTVAFVVTDGGEPGAYVDRLDITSAFPSGNLAGFCEGSLALSDLGSRRGVALYSVVDGNIQVHKFD